MSRRPVFYQDLVLYNNSQISWADFHTSQFVPVWVDIICPWSTLRYLPKHPIYHSFGSPWKKCTFLTINQYQSLDSVSSKTKLLHRPKSKCKLLKYTKVQVCLICHVKVSQLQKNIQIEDHQSQPTNMTFWTAC